MYHLQIMLISSKFIHFFAQKDRCLPWPGVIEISTEKLFWHNAYNSGSVKMKKERAMLNVHYTSIMSPMFILQDNESRFSNWTSSSYSESLRHLINLVEPLSHVGGLHIQYSVLRDPTRCLYKHRASLSNFDSERPFSQEPTSDSQFIKLLQQPQAGNAIERFL